MSYEKSNFPPGSFPTAQGYPGPPEYVEQEFPMQPSYPPPPMAVQSHAMHNMPYGAQHVPGYPLPVMQQPLPQAISEGFYLENPPTPTRGNGDPSVALDYLSTVTTLQVRQKIEILELLTDIEMANKYTVYNENGQAVFNAAESSDCCARQCCGSIRPIEIIITDIFNNEVIHLHRPLKCDTCLYPCCLQKMEVTCPPGTVVSTVEQNWSLWPSFNVKDAVGNNILKIEGPYFTCSCRCSNVDFEVLSASDGMHVGRITKKWSGYAHEVFTDADNFIVTFPLDLDIMFKAALLGAVFLIDMMYYEERPQRRQ